MSIFEPTDNYKKESNKPICEVSFCDSEATQDIMIDTEKFGEMTFSVCSGCSLKLKRIQQALKMVK